MSRTLPPPARAAAGGDGGGRRRAVTPAQVVEDRLRLARGRAVGFRLRGIGRVVESVDDPRADALADQLLDRAQEAVLPTAGEGECGSGAPGASGPPDAVDVVLRALRHVVVDDVADG